MNSPTISIIMRSFNRERTIAKSINSVLDQDYKNFELIVVDDGSTDSTLKIVENFNEPRIKIVRHRTNLGLTAGLNSGYAACSKSSSAIAFLDSDDMWRSDHLSKCCQKLFGNVELGFVYTQTVGRGLKKDRGCDQFIKILSNLSLAPLGSILISQASSRLIFPLPENIDMCEDDIICLELSRTNCFDYIRDYTYQPLGSENSVTRNFALVAEGWEKLFNRYSREIELYCSGEQKFFLLRKQAMVFACANKFDASIELMVKAIGYLEVSKFSKLRKFLFALTWILLRVIKIRIFNFSPRFLNSLRKYFSP